VRFGDDATPITVEEAIPVLRRLLGYDAVVAGA